jgi:hypothetical protein
VDHPQDQTRSLTDKLETFDRYAPAAVVFLIDWLEHEHEALIAVAKGRHAEGHYRYADKLMYEYADDELIAEASQELGDAINYVMLLLSRKPPLRSVA